MSGVDEKKKKKKKTEPNLACPVCESFKYEYITHGYVVDLIDVQRKYYRFDDFEGTEGEGWKCLGCGRKATGRIKDFLWSQRYHGWPRGDL